MRTGKAMSLLAVLIRCHYARLGWPGPRLYRQRP